MKPLFRLLKIYVYRRDFSSLCIKMIFQPILYQKKDIAMAQVEGKPPQAVEKIVAGKLRNTFLDLVYWSSS